MYDTYITPSLLDAFCNGYDWIGMIKREPKELNQAMQNGIDFEKAVINKEFEELNQYVEGCLYQQFLCGKFDKYFLLGFADIINRNLIIDLKFKQSYECPQYYNSNQRLIYPALTDIPNFSYVIGTGTNPHKPNSIYWETYTRNDKLLLERLNQLNSAIDFFNLREVYKQNYNVERYEKEIKNYEIS